jgi:hypothetical protein
MKIQNRALLTGAFLAVAGVYSQTHAAIIVNDTWKDGTRTDPNSASGYTENGVDLDNDGDIESAWFGAGGTGSSLTVSDQNTLRATLGPSGSSSFTTYFAKPDAPLALTNAGDNLKVTWQFTVTNLGASNTSQNFRLALVNTPSANALTADGAPGDAAYAGYGMFMNMSAGNLGGSNPFQLMERTDAATASPFLGASASWAARANGATTGRIGYKENVLYTFTLDLTRTENGGLTIISSMAGGTGVTAFNGLTTNPELNGPGIATLTFTDTTPNSFSFDTFGVRPSSAPGAAEIFDTSLFKVEFTQVPEPSSMAVFGATALLGLCRRRRAGA